MIKKVDRMDRNPFNGVPFAEPRILYTLLVCQSPMTRSPHGWGISHPMNSAPRNAKMRYSDMWLWYEMFADSLALGTLIGR